MKRFFALVLAMLCLFAFVACDEDTDTEGNNKKDDAELILGTWEAEIDMTEALNESMNFDEEMAGYITIEDFKITVQMTLNDDGTYKSLTTEESANEAFGNLKKAMVDGLTAYFTDVATQANISLNDLLAAMNLTSVEEYVNIAFDESVMDEMTGGFVSEGLYKIEDGKFYTTDDGEEEIDESEYEEYTLSAKQFKLTKYVGEDEDEVEFAEYIYPIVFKKVK